MEVLSVLGYRNNFAVGRNESLLSLATAPLSRTLKQAREPRALAFQYCYAESAVVSHDVSETDIALRTRYFAAEVMRELELDHFAVFLFICYRLLRLHLGLDYGSRSIPVPPDERPVICIMEDCMSPRGSLRHRTKTNPR